MEHIHVNFLEFMVFGAMLMIWNFLLRTFAARFHENSFGKAVGTFA